MYVDIEMPMNKQNSCRKSNSCLAIFFLLMMGSFGIGFAQETQAKNEAEIRALIKKSRSKDLKASDEANQALSNLDAKSIPTLTRILKNGNPCERVEAAKLLIDLDRNNKDVIPELIHLATGGNLLSLFNLKEEMMCRRGAAFLLAFSADGIRALTRMLKDGDLFERQSAIFAFDELTETSNYPEGSLQAMKEAIPIIAESGKSKDEVMQNMSNEVLWQIVRHSSKELIEIAKKYVNENQ
jgi:HEAT repeat protein